MNLKLKTLLVLSGVALLAVPALHAQGRGGRGGGGGFGGARPSLASRPASFAGARPLASGGRFTNSRPSRGGYYGRGGYYRGGGYGHHYGRYYYLGGVPYLYPFYGYGYPYYGGFYGDGFGGYGGFYGAYGSSGYADGAYNGSISSARDGQDDDGQDNARASKGSGPSLPTAVQRQLAKRGYYKGSVDGQFGPASREALGRFQKSQGIKQTGRIDEDSLEALGFTDQR